MNEDEIIVVQETEYTGAGKSPQPQLSFAREMGIDIKFGNPDEEIPGVNIILPEHPSKIAVRHVDLDKLKKSYIKKSVNHVSATYADERDIAYLMKETRKDKAFVTEVLKEMGVVLK